MGHHKTNAYHLFVKRLKFEWNFQYRVIRTVVDDWSVLAYLIVPTVLYLILYYAYLWSTQPEWIYNVTVFQFAIFLFLVIGFRNMRSFFDYADQLFLLQRKSWISKLRKYGMWYSLFVNFIVVFLLLLGWLPIIYYGFSMNAPQIILLFVFTSLFISPFSILKKKIGITNKFLPRMLWKSILFIIGGIIYVELINLDNSILLGFGVIILGIVNVWLIHREPENYKAHFVEYVDYDLRDRFKILALILNNTGHKVQNVRSVRSRPILFKNSIQLFRERTSSNILAESCFKAFFRDPQYNKVYLRFILFSCFGVFYLPDLIGYIFLLGFGLIHFSISKMIWFQFLNSDFLKLYSWTVDIKQEAGKKEMFMLTLPGYFIVVVTFLLASQSPLNVVIRFIASLFIFYICILISYKKLQRLFSVFCSSKFRKNEGENS